MPGVTANSTDELYIGNSAPAGTAATLPYSVNGNRNSGNNWTIDGADNVDRGSNLTLMMFPSIDSIAEFKVERSLYTADTGRAGGAQVNVVTKSGTSQYHGDLYEFVRNNAFAANNWINNAQKVLVNGSVQVPPLRWNDFGGTIGGPVPLGHKDNHKTFFFLLGRGAAHHHIHDAQSDAADAGHGTGHIFTACLHPVHDLLPVDGHPDSG